MIEVKRRMPCGTFVYATIDPETESSAVALEEEAQLHKVACQECCDFQPFYWPRPSHRDQRGYSAFWHTAPGLTAWQKGEDDD